MLKIKINEKIYEVENPCNLEEFANEIGVDAIAVKVNNRLRELNYNLTFDAEVEYLDLTSSDAMVLYNASIRFLLAMAVKNLYPEARTIFKNSISRSLYLEIMNIGPITNRILNEIEAELKRLVDAKLPIFRTKMTKEEAINYYRDKGQRDKVSLLEFRPDRDVHLYQCEDYIDYMCSYMVTNTSKLSKYKLHIYAPGIIIQLPRAEEKGQIPDFEDAPTFANVLNEASNWGKLINAGYVSRINKLILDGQELELINLCETRHNDMLADLGRKIADDISKIRLIAVAGPSSSGKTTFTNRLRIELTARGIKPLMISIDDYYLSKDQAPKDEFGDPDLEHIEALDIELFNKQMYQLINGEEVSLPLFNFETGKREWKTPVKVGPNTPILIEGIHALNDDLTPSIPKSKKFKIYIAPQSQLHLDDHNPISLTELRLIRRLVRDKKFRNAAADETLKMWPSVRRGEFKWIYKNQEGVDYVFNSELTYEICVLKKYALPMLKDIKEDSPYYIQANRLIKFLKYFNDIEDDWIPSNSIIREFIGNSIFYRK